MTLGLALPALLRWPLVLAPLYALVVAVVLVALFLGWREGREPFKQAPQRDRKAFRVIRGGHQS